MKFVKGDILDAKHGIIGHQVNCRMVMGAGLAKQIRDKYPMVFTEYKEVMGAAEYHKRLGKCQLVQVGPDLYVANLFGQADFVPRGVCHTDYNALSMAMNGLHDWRKMNWSAEVDMPIYLPSGLGCGLAGGDWKVVEGLISSAIPDATIVRYNK
jgi:O-acetyl-ADP-ribose deacetylase (regulator of RNase III)